MSASLRLRIGVVAAGLCCLLLGYASAQQGQTAGQIGSDRSRESASNAAGQTDRSTAQQSDRSTARPGERTYGESSQRRTANYRGVQPNAVGANQAVDRFFATCLLAKNESEVQLSELAQQKAENPDVKQFAQQMIQDHRKMIEQLQPLAGMASGTSRGVSGSLGTTSESKRSTDTTALPGASAASETIPPSGTTAATPSIGTTTDTAAGVTTTERSNAGNGAVQQIMQIDRKINERCTQAAREELQQKSGVEFDKCFVGNAISAHVHALAALEVIGQQTQGPLAQVAQQAQPAVQQHLEHAKQLMKQLEGQASTGAGAAERSTTRTQP